MKRKFSKFWKSSKQPRKQRKYLANAPLHIKRKSLGVGLSKDLRVKHKKRSIPVKKGDVVKILKGKFKGKQGKVNRVLTKRLKIYIDEIQRKKQDGSKVGIPFKASNLQIITLNLDDKKRLLSLNKNQNTEKKDLKLEKTDKKMENKK